MQIIDKSNYKLPEGIRNILLIQLGDIGDVVWTTPSIRAVKNSVPKAKVSVLVKDGFGGLLEADPSVEQVFEVKRYRGNLFHQAAGQLSFLRELRAQHFDLVVDLRLGDRGAFMAFATGAPMRLAVHYYEGLPFWRPYCFTHGLVPPPEGAQHRGASEQSLWILRGLGMDINDTTPKLWISDAVKKRVQNILAYDEVAGHQCRISINPFSRWPYKEWDDHKWIEIINWLWKDCGIPSVVIGSLEERPRAKALTGQCEADVINLTGKTTLAELAGVLSLSRLHIGVDSAAPHIAAATGTPTITIYGPSSWLDWAPVGENHRVILPKMDCVPCHQKGCNNSGHSRCLETLTVDQVKNVIHETLESSLNYPRL